MGGGACKTAFFLANALSFASGAALAAPETVGCGAKTTVFATVTTVFITKTVVCVALSVVSLTKTNVFATETVGCDESPPGAGQRRPSP